MASTIKLKSITTAGNAPSSLETGEFAINVKDGNLFYGSSSAVKQHFVVDELEVKGNLTAQQYIVSSSVVYTTQSFSSGSTAFGDSADDTHVFTGNITASGNISASGDVIAHDFTADKNSTDGYFFTGHGRPILSQHGVGGHLQLGSGHSSVDHSGIKLLTTGSDSSKGLFLDSIGNVTASGDISSSATLTVKKNKFLVTSNTVGDHQGDVVFFGSTTSMTAGGIYYYNSSGNWALADADAESTAKGLLAVALGTASDTDGMLLRGTVTLFSDPGTIGDVVYLSTTAGRAQSTAPSGNGDIVRVMGYCLDSSNKQIWFNPDNTFIEVSA